MPPQAAHMLAPPSTPFWQTAPLWQMSPAQQAMPAAPHIMQMFGPVAGFAQPRPVLHVLPAQHCWLFAPHGWQLLAPVPPSAGAWQDMPVLQVFAAPPPQQGWPVPPQVPHTPMAQTTPGAVQVPPLPPQQFCVEPPHVPHEPFMHIPEVPMPVHVVPAATQSPPMQQPPLLQVFRAQQA